MRVLSARENISDDASGILMEAVLERMAEYYSVELSQKIRRGISLNVEKRLYTGGGVPLGYFVDESKQIQVDSATAPIVMKIFEMYATGSTMADIIRYLNGQQIKTSYGNVFNKNSINRILKNKRYIGYYIYKDVEVAESIPRIISDTLFYEVQDMMKKKKKECAELEQQILLENVRHPSPTVDEVKFFMSQLKKGDINDSKYREALIDTFVNKVYLYDDKMTILYNSQNSHSNVTIDDLGSSGVTQLEMKHTYQYPRLKYGTGVYGDCIFSILFCMWVSLVVSTIISTHNYSALISLIVNPVAFAISSIFILRFSKFLAISVRSSSLPSCFALRSLDILSLRCFSLASYSERVFES